MLDLIGRLLNSAHSDLCSAKIFLSLPVLSNAAQLTGGPRNQ